MDRTCCFASAPTFISTSPSTSPMKKHIVVETVAANDNDHINKRIGQFFGANVYFGTVMGVRKLKYEPLWGIQFNNTNVYYYNLPQVLDALEN